MTHKEKLMINAILESIGLESLKLDENQAQED